MRHLFQIELDGDGKGGWEASFAHGRAYRSTVKRGLDDRGLVQFIVTEVVDTLSCITDNGPTRSSAASFSSVAQLLRALLRAAPGGDVMGLPCFCDSPELHSEECVAVRQLVSKIQFELGQPLAMMLAELEEDDEDVRWLIQQAQTPSGLATLRDLVRMTDGPATTPLEIHMRRKTQMLVAAYKKSTGKDLMP